MDEQQILEEEYQRERGYDFNIKLQRRGKGISYKIAQSPKV